MGATVVTRGGVSVLNTEQRILAPEAFSAMTAALMSAAETAFYHLGGGRDVRVIAESDSTRMITVGADDELLLVVIARASSDTHRLLPALEESATRLRAILAEDKP